MKKRFTFLIAAIAAMLMMAQPTKVMGQTRTDEVYKSLIFNSSNDNQTDQYTGTWSTTYNNTSWTMQYFSNYNWGWPTSSGASTYIIKCGRKKTKSGNTPSKATITTDAAIDQAITKVVVALTAINSNDYNSIKLYMASTSAFDEDNDDYFETITVSPIPTSAGDMTITIPEAKRAANRYYKIEFDTKGSTSGNGHTGVSKVEYYKAAAAPAYTITAQSNNTNLGTVSLAGTVITGAPAANCRYASPAYTVEPANSATVVQDNENINKFTVTPTANTTVTINFEAIPQYAVTFSVNGATSSQNYYEGATIIFPANPANIYGKTFVGWTTTAIEGTTNTPPTMVNTSEAITCTAAVTYYAVFADMTGSASPTLTKMTSEDTFAANDNVVIVASGNVAMYQETTTSPTNYVNKWSFDNNAATVAADNKKMFTVSAGSSSGTWKLGDATNGYVYNSSSNDLKIDKDNSTNFTLAWNGTVNQVEINKFTLIGNDRWLSYRSDLTNNYFRMGGATSGTASGTVYFDIYKYSTGSVSYINYCTTVTPPAVEIPEIVITSNPFLFSTTVTITCGTEGASIKYRYNENDSWSDYSAALTITETKTIYAKGVKGDDESLVAQATATKNLANPTVTVSGDLIVDLVGETNVSAGSLSATVTYNNEAVVGATVTWESNHTDIATIDASTGAVTLLTTGEVTFTATYTGNNDYAEATGTKTVTVVNSKAPGTVYNPYTVAQARTVISALNNNGTLNDKYVRGIISSVGDYNSKYSSITYWISDDGTETSELQVYSGKGIGGADFAAASDLKTGDQVVVYGQLKKYVSGNTTTLEFNQNSQIYSLIRPGTNNNPTTIAGTVVDFTIANNESYTVAANTILTVTGTLVNNNPANLIIEDGGQLLIYDNGAKDGVQATVQKEITGASNWGTTGDPYTPNGWYFIASPINVNNLVPTAVTDMTFGDYDLYQFDPSTEVWQNYKEHEGNAAAGFNLANGRGYLYANSDDVTLQFAGTVKPYTTTGNANQMTLETGWNLIGNPYTFAAYIDKPYYSLNDDRTTILATSIKNEAVDPCTGVIVNGGDGSDDVTIGFYTVSQDIASPNHGNLQMVLSQTVATRGESNTVTLDNAIVSFNEGTELEKFYFGNQDANIYIPQNNEQYAIVSSEARGEMPVCFKANRDGQFTINVNAENVEMSYLHLIDNIAGQDVDLIATPSYTFDAKGDDYESRFRLVFSASQNENDNQNEDFAFISNGEIIVNGTGTIQIVDIMGRVVSTKSTEERISTNGMTPGVYVLRLIGNDTKTQKIVVK